MSRRFEPGHALCGEPPGWSRLIGVIFLLSGCQLVGVSRGTPEPAPIPEPPEREAVQPRQEIAVPQGDFRGVLLVEGESMQAHLLLLQEAGGGFSGILEGPVDFRAEGRGTVSGREVRLELSYGGECPGTMVLIGDWVPDSDTFSGIVRANDCTGPGQGTFRFSRFLLVFSH